MNFKHSAQSQPVERMWWWHPHFTDVAAEAVSADSAGMWWWHPHTKIADAQD